MSAGTFFVLGRPLNERAPADEAFISLVSQSQLIIGESRKITERLLAHIPVSKDTPVFYLDNAKPQEMKALEETLKRISKEKGAACLFSDMGMPILFDPGSKSLELAKKIGMKIRVLPGPTCWGTAAALSGWSPPFQLVGFLSPKAEFRIQELSQLRSEKAHLILLDTPYRFQALLTDCHKTFGGEHQVFLAWEIGTPEEIYFWGSLNQLLLKSETEGLKKGEFILLLQKPSVK